MTWRHSAGKPVLKQRRVPRQQTRDGECVTMHRRREGGGTGGCVWCRRPMCPSGEHEEGVGCKCSRCVRGVRVHTNARARALVHSLTISVSYTTPLRNKHQQNIKKL